MLGTVSKLYLDWECRVSGGVLALCEGIDGALGSILHPHTQNLKRLISTTT